MLATVLVVLGAIVGITTLLDMLLSDRQKVALAHGVTVFWNLLDEAKRGSFLNWMRGKDDGIYFIKYIATGLTWTTLGLAGLKAGLLYSPYLIAIHSAIT